MIVKNFPPTIPSTKPESIHTNHRALLIGNPNVGKSALFSALTGIRAESSNFSGTTVDYLSGKFTINGQSYTLIDVPGIYSLTATSPAENIALHFLNQGADYILCVLDATNLVRSIHLALELKRYQIPILYILNMTDVAKRYGIVIDTKALSNELGGTVVATSAVKKHGIDLLYDALDSSAFHSNADTPKISTAERITQKVQTISKHKKLFIDKLSDYMIHPLFGIPIALMILSMAIFLVIFGGETIIHFIGQPLAQFFTSFFYDSLSPVLSNGFWRELLIGAYGITITPFEWVLGSILPYVVMYYAVFSFLEDCGYLPRLAVLFDHIMSKLGIQGGNLISLLLGYGCAVPAIIGSRTASSKKERHIIAFLVCLTIPCASQTGALLRLFQGRAWWLLPALVILSFVCMILLTAILNKCLKGRVQPMILEIPHLLMPNSRTYLSKLRLRLKQFFIDAELPMLFALLFASILAATGSLNWLGKWCSPVIVNWLGLPKEASIALITGILRREMSVAPLLALDLTTLQTLVSATVSLFYLPCFSTFAILIKEFGIKLAGSIALFSFFFAFFMGGVVNFIGQLVF